MTDSAADVIAFLSGLGCGRVDDPTEEVENSSTPAMLDAPELPVVEVDLVDVDRLAVACNVARADALILFADRLRRVAWRLHGPRWIQTPDGLRRAPAPLGDEALRDVEDRALLEIADVAILEAIELVGDLYGVEDLEADDE